MPIKESAKKALRQSKKRALRNLKKKKELKEITKKIRKLTAAKKTEEARKLLPLAYKTIDKCAKIGIIKKNNANRKKSVLAKVIKK